MLRRLLIQSVATLAVMAGLLFGAAGTLDWPGAWAFFAETSVGGALLGRWLWRHDPALLRERLALPIQRGQALWDRVFVISVLVLWCGWFALMGLDRGRWRLAPMPMPMAVAGALLIAAGLAVSWQTFRANSFAAPVVRVQTERGHAVASTGPYRFVRHPMYAGAILYLVGSPLLLGSWLGLLTVPLLIAGFALRIGYEEDVLRRELAGYEDYMKRVRWRLVPGVW